jgi:hypothetical protein
LLAAALMPCIAAAALGEPEDSVQADGARLHATLKMTAHAQYRVHEMQLPSGTSVREFVAMSGTVFAVAWSGPAMPNLRQTFGRYFDTYVAAAKGRTASHLPAGHTLAGHTQLQIRQDDLVVESGGHMRAFAGRAYLPQAVPAGVDIGDLR